MKIFIIVLWIFFALNASAKDRVYDFFFDQMKVEQRIIDQNLSTTEIETILETQYTQYRHFLLELVANKTKFVEMSDPDSTEISKLKRRMQINQQRGNEYAYLRDEIKLNSYEIYRSIRHTLKEVMFATELNSKKLFDEKINEIVTQRYTNISILDASKYTFSLEEMQGSSILQEMQKNLETNMLLRQVNNTFSSELIENVDAIYNTVLLSGFGLFSLSYKINNSAIGNMLNPLLSYVALDSAKIVLIAIVILLIFFLRKIIVVVIEKILQKIVLKQDDIELVLEGTSTLFNWLITVAMLHIILMIFAGFADIKWLSKLFEIIYVILTVLFVYKLVNAIATIKIDDLNRTKLLRNEVINLGLKANNILLLLVGIILILSILGVNLTAILSGLGIGGFAVAFAAKDSIANIFGSVSILMGDLFEQGDWIALDDMEGTVVEIGLRATTIRTFDNALIAIPNFKLSDSGIKNWSRRTIGRRIKMQIGVTYQSDFNDIKKTVESIRSMLQEHPDIASEKMDYFGTERHSKLVSKEDLKGVKRTTLVYMDQFSASSIDILVYCFSRSVVWNEWLEVKEDVMYKVAEILKENNLEFAYPTMTLFHEGKSE